MSHISQRRPSAGFTLIELLTVVAIIGILASIIIPTLGAVQENIKRSTEGANLRSIGAAAINYASSNDGALPDPIREEKFSGKLSSAGGRYYIWLGILAKSGDMTESKLYFSKIDKGTTPVIDFPASILSPDKKSVATAFSDLIPAYEVIGGLRQSDKSTTPIAYTRGLNEEGTWDIKKGVYADWGGHAVFLNGSLQSFQGGIKNKLTDTNDKETSNIRTTVKKGTNTRFYGPANLAIIGTPTGSEAVVPR